MDRSNLTAMISPVVMPIGLEVDRVEVVGAGQRRLVRIRLDGDGPKGTGPDLDQISTATKLISAALDQADMGSQPYVLEVSSRGIEAPLTTPAHFRRNHGRLVGIDLRDGATLRGHIVASDNQSVTVDDEAGGRTVIAYGEISRAQVQVEFNRSGDVEEE